MMGNIRLEAAICFATTLIPGVVLGINIPFAGPCLGAFLGGVVACLIAGRPSRGAVAGDYSV